MPGEISTWTADKKKTLEEALRVSRRNCKERGHDWDVADVMSVLEEQKVVAR